MQTAFFDPASTVAALPTVLVGLWLDGQVPFFASIGVAVVATLFTVARPVGSPVLAAPRLLATARTDLCRGPPVLVVLCLIGFGVRRAAVHAAQPAVHTADRLVDRAGAGCSARIERR